jgi:hypothetical protein
VGRYSNICVRLRGTLARLDEILRGVSRGVLIRKPGDRWSAQEHAGHLLDLESLWMGRADDFLGKLQPALFARSRLHPRLKQPMLRSTTTIT